MRLPAVCRSCGRIVASGYFVRSPDITMSGNTTGCPHCGGIADVIDGTFDASGDELRIKAAPPRTAEVLRILAEAVAAARGEGSVEEIFEKVASASPEAAQEVRTLYASGGRPLLLLCLLVWLHSCTTKGEVNWNHLFDQMRVAVTGGEPYSFPEAASRQSAEPSKRQRREKLERPSPKEKAQTPSKPDRPKAKRNHRKKMAERQAQRAAMRPR